jgi:peroxiredoxin
MFLPFVAIGLLAATSAASRGASPVADFTLPSATDGSMIRLSNYSGEVVLINWWRSSCGYCQRETPKLVQLYQKYHDKGLVVIGVSDDTADSVANVPGFIKKHGITFPVGLNDQGEFFREIRSLGSGSTPCNYLVSRSGELTFLGLVRSSEKDWKTIEQAVVTALAEPVPDQRRQSSE